MRLSIRMVWSWHWIMQAMPLFLVIIYLNWLKSLSSRVAYNSCNLEDARSNCTQCDNLKHRILFNSVSPSECICDVGWFDDGSNELCLECHYSWFDYCILHILNFPICNYCELLRNCKSIIYKLKRMTKFSGIASIVLRLDHTTHFHKGKRHLVIFSVYHYCKSNNHQQLILLNNCHILYAN